MDRKNIETTHAPKPIGPYSQAVRACGWLYVSGQIPIDPETGKIVEGPFELQVRTVLDNVSKILEAGGSSLDKTVKVTIFLADMERFAEFNAIYEEYFGRSRPARACVEVSRLPGNVPLEIEAVAVCGETNA